MNKTIAVIGSSRRNGNTGKLIDIIAKELNIEVIDLSLKDISPFDYEHKNFDDDFLPLMDHILLHDNIIFVSPVYWFSMSAQMKIFVDRMSDFLSLEELKNTGRKLRGKIGYVVSTSISEKVDDSFIDSFTNTFEYLGMGYGGCVHLDCSSGFDINNGESDLDQFIKTIKLHNVKNSI
jgi:multimeric flavodoxin WrbA